MHPTVVAESSAREVRWGRLNAPEESSENSHGNALILQPFPSGRSARHVQATSAPRGANDTRPSDGSRGDVAVAGKRRDSGSSPHEGSRHRRVERNEKRLPQSEDAATNLSAERVQF